jgi:hypothetical protein
MVKPMLACTTERTGDEHAIPLSDHQTAGLVKETVD